MNLKEVQTHSEHFAIIISTIFNFLLLVLTITEKNRTVASYRNLILLNITTETLFTLFITVSQPTLQFLDGNYIAISNGPFRHLSYKFHCYMIGAYILGLGMSFITLPVDFVYRYLIVCRRTQVKVSHLLGFTFMAYVYSIWDAYWITLSFLETPDASEQYGHLLMDPMWFEDGQQMTFVASSFDSTPLRMFIFSATTVITLVYISVFMFSKHVFRELGQRKHLMSKKTIEMQQGMNRMLIAQALVPLFTGLIPIIVMLVSTTFRWTYPWTGFFTSFCICWLPTISPICAIYFITSFRRRILKFFHFGVRKTSRSPTSLQNISSNLA